MEKLTRQREDNAKFARSYLLKYKIKHYLEFIYENKKQGTSLISMTIPPRRGDVEKGIKVAYQKSVNAGNIKNRINRESVVDICNKLVAYLRSLSMYYVESGYGLILFVGVFGKLEHVLVVEIPPTELVTYFTYNCDTTVSMSYVENMTKSKVSRLFAVVDGYGIRIWSDIQGVYSREYYEDYFKVRFQNHGGQSQNRFLHTAYNNRHQQVTNSISQLLGVIRNKNRTFDSLFVCGNPEFRKEVLSGFKESDLAGRVSVVRDIPLSVDSVNLNSLNELKANIANITEFIAEDTIYNEKQYIEKVERFLQLEEGKIEFGLAGVLYAIADGNVSLLVIDEYSKYVVTAYHLADVGLDLTYLGEREQVLLVELLLEYALYQNVELAVIQSENARSFLRSFGGFYVVLKY